MDLITMGLINKSSRIKGSRIDSRQAEFLCRRESAPPPAQCPDACCAPQLAPSSAPKDDSGASRSPKSKKKIRFLHRGSTGRSGAAVADTEIAEKKPTKVFVSRILCGLSLRS